MNKLEELKSKIDLGTNKNMYFKEYVKSKVSDIIIMPSFGKNKLEYWVGEDSIGYIQYDILEKNVVIKFIKSINSNLENDKKIAGIGEYILKDFIVNTTFDSYTLNTITMTSRKFYFNVIRKLLKEKIISEVFYDRDPLRVYHNRLDEDMKKVVEHNHAFKNIFIKK